MADYLQQKQRFLVYVSLLLEIDPTQRKHLIRNFHFEWFRIHSVVRPFQQFSNSFPVVSKNASDQFFMFQCFIDNRGIRTEHGSTNCGEATSAVCESQADW